MPWSFVVRTALRRPGFASVDAADLVAQSGFSRPADFAGFGSAQLAAVGSAFAAFVVVGVERQPVVAVSTSAAGRPSAVAAHALPPVAAGAAASSSDAAEPAAGAAAACAGVASAVAVVAFAAGASFAAAEGGNYDRLHASHCGAEPL